MTESCTYCQAARAEPYELPIRKNEPTKTYLCDSCYAALKQAVQTG